MNSLNKIVLHNKMLVRNPRPSCKNCVHYSENNNTCKLFVYEVEGFKEHCLKVELCREFVGLCGPDAKHFEQK
jgi:hypothetical protein